MTNPQTPSELRKTEHAAVIEQIIDTAVRHQRLLPVGNSPWQAVIPLLKAAPGLLEFAKTIRGTADSAVETGHSPADVVAANWDVLDPMCRAAIAKAAPPVVPPEPEEDFDPLHALDAAFDACDGEIELNAPDPEPTKYDNDDYTDDDYAG